ncbi:MAG: hypothetical protein ACRDP3_24640, partial [Streptomyces sp.]
MPRNIEPDRDDDGRGDFEHGHEHGHDPGRDHGRAHGRDRERARCVVPDLRPVRPGHRGRHRLRRLVYGRRRVTAAGLAVAAAALAAAAP